MVELPLFYVTISLHFVMFVYNYNECYYCVPTTFRGISLNSGEVLKAQH